MAKERKVRVDFHKNRQQRRREVDLTRDYHRDDEAAELADSTERVRAKGDLSRKRTVKLTPESDKLAVDESQCRRGRVLAPIGLHCVVVTDEGEQFRCFTRRLLKTLASDARNVVAAGDHVLFRPAPGNEGFIVRVEPRTTELTRSYRRREHVIAANVDQVLIVASTAQPELKPRLIDRYLVTAERAGIRPIICLNKVDLVDGAKLAPLVGLYSQLGYETFLTSVTTNKGMKAIRRALAARETVIVGQSGVGKSSLLNALEPTLQLRVAAVSAATSKGRHTTTTARMLRLSGGGVVIDTPGVRQFEAWELPLAEIDRFFIEFRPFLADCRFPGCSHAQEIGCGVKAAVAAGLIAMSRYESYLRLRLAGGAVAPGDEA